MDTILKLYKASEVETFLEKYMYNSCFSKSTLFVTIFDECSFTLRIDDKVLFHFIGTPHQFAVSLAFISQFACCFKIIEIL